MSTALARLVAAVVLTALGALATRRWGQAPLASAVSRFLIAFSIPVLTWYTVAVSMPRYSQLAGVAAVGIAYMVAGFVLAYAASRRAAARLGWSCGRAAAVVLASVVQNSIFIPVPLALLMGRDVDHVMAYSLSYNLAVAVAVPFVAGSCGGSVGVGRIIARYPPFYGLLAGIAAAPLLAGHAVPPVVELARRIAAESTLLSFYLVGAGVAAAWPPRLGSGEAAVLAWRHLLSPLIHVLLAVPLGLEGWGLESVLLESVMPPATMNIVFARYYGLDERLVASSMAISTPIGLLEALALVSIA
ncbi:AEC family transporter [Pyrodictium abyssi]|uniref:Permease n=1 Tax=Pyrodictium abyssi TaxID=54256 RepID=A0ABN6ZJS5_9CREN|nr:hypothetical protein PABY_00740 [Pyrodictium abyssi]